MPGSPDENNYVIINKDDYRGNNGQSAAHELYGHFLSYLLFGKNNAGHSNPIVDQATKKAESNIEEKKSGPPTESKPKK